MSIARYHNNLSQTLRYTILNDKHCKRIAKGMVTYDFMASNVFAQKSKTTPPHINSDQDPGIEPDTSDTGVFL